MKIFEDILIKESGENKELLSDSFPIKEIDGVILEAECAMIELGAIDVNTGANASAEEASEDLDDGVQKVNNILHTFGYQETAFDKKSYTAYLKGYFGALTKELKANGTPEEEITNFKTKAGAFFKDKISKNFADFEFFTGPSGNPDGMVVLLNYREDGVTPYVLLWKHGLREIKV